LGGWGAKEITTQEACFGKNFGKNYEKKKNKRVEYQGGTGGTKDNGAWRKIIKQGGKSDWPKHNSLMPSKKLGEV